VEVISVIKAVEIEPHTKLVGEEIKTTKSEVDVETLVLILQGF
jgi:hypothetical protein